MRSKINLLHLTQSVQLNTLDAVVSRPDWAVGSPSHFAWGEVWG